MSAVLPFCLSLCPQTGPGRGEVEGNPTDPDHNERNDDMAYPVPALVRCYYGAFTVTGKDWRPCYDCYEWDHPSALSDEELDRWLAGDLEDDEVLLAERARRRSDG